MKDAAIVGVARTPIGKAGRGSLNATHGATMAGHAIAAAIARSGVDPAAHGPKARPETTSPA